MTIRESIRISETVDVQMAPGAAAFDPYADAVIADDIDPNAQSIIESCENAIALGLEVHQEVVVDMCDRDGRPIPTGGPYHNIVTTRGLQYVADAMKRGSAAFAAMTGMKLGSSSQTPVVGDLDVVTALGVSGEFKAFASGYPLHASATITFRSIWIPGEATATGIREVAIKSATGVADAISRALIGSQDKDALATMTITTTWRFN